MVDFGSGPRFAGFHNLILINCRCVTSRSLFATGGVVRYVEDCKKARTPAWAERCCLGMGTNLSFFLFSFQKQNTAESPGKVSKQRSTTGTFSPEIQNPAGPHPPRPRSSIGKMARTAPEKSPVFSNPCLGFQFLGNVEDGLHIALTVVVVVYHLTGGGAIDAGIPAVLL